MYPIAKETICNIFGMSCGTNSRTACVYSLLNHFHILAKNLGWSK
jgi:hypothetical protein